MQRETYNISEHNKLLIEEITVGDVVTTYKGLCDLEDYVGTSTESEEKWSILKVVETTSGGTVTTEFFRPAVDGKMSVDKKFARDERSSLTYL